MFSFTYNEMTTKFLNSSDIGIYIENIHKIRFCSNLCKDLKIDFRFGLAANKNSLESVNTVIVKRAFSKCFKILDDDSMLCKQTRNAYI